MRLSVFPCITRTMPVVSAKSFALTFSSHMETPRSTRRLTLTFLSERGVQEW